jgi:sugar porter (SP) family MFS transporter
MKLNANLTRSTGVAALGGLLFGFDTAVIAGTTHGLTEAFRLTPSSLGLTVSIALWGTILGAMTAGIPGDRLGRRTSLKLMALFYLLSSLGCAFAWSWTSLVVFRFIGGLGIGGSSVLAPMYIAEVAPAEERGRLVGSFQISIVVGILVAYFSNYIVALNHLGALDWRWKFGIPAVPAALFLILLFRILPSPRWLVTRGRTDEARHVLALVGEADPVRAVAEIVASLHQDRPQDRLFSWKYRFPIFLAVSIAIFNQFSGINAILYYLNDIFARAGFSGVSGDLQAVAIGATNLIFTLIAMSVIDRLGRKTLLLVGSVGTALCLAGVSFVFATARHETWLLWLLIGFIACFAFSQGAVIWVYLSEVFPTQVRAKGQSLGSFTHWVMNALISFEFPRLAAASGAYPFVFFTGMMVLQFFVVLFAYPETKNVSLEAMQQKLGVA